MLYIFITLAENYIYTFIIIDGNLDNNEIYVYLLRKQFIKNYENKDLVTLELI